MCIMNTFFSCQCDSVVTKVCGSLVPVVKETHEAGTNCHDVWIVGIICTSIVIVAFIGAFVVLSWKSKEIKEKENERGSIKQKDKDEYDRKKEANEQNRQWMLEDEKRKRQYSIEDEERKRTYDIEDEERKRKNAREDEELKQEQNEKTTLQS